MSSSSCSSPVLQDGKIRSEEFYREYYGHKVEHLEVIHKRIAPAHRPRIWLVGDSSLDNKHWLPSELSTPACNGYERVLEPALSARDVCFCLNKELESNHGHHGLQPSANSGASSERLSSAEHIPVVINCAIEESTVGARAKGLFPQDRFVRDHISTEDTLIVSVGGNDIALRPSFMTAISVLAGVFLNARRHYENPSSAWGMPAYRHLFGRSTQRYIERLISVTRPRRVIVCMIYYPDVSPAPSWAGRVLGVLQYNNHPEKLQALIKGVFEEVTSKIELDGTEVVACPLFRAMDGSDTSQYVARVEPSEKGGEAMAKLLADFIFRPANTLMETKA